MKDILLLFGGIVAGAFGANLLKRGLVQVEFHQLFSLNTITGVFTNSSILLGLFLYLIPTVIIMYLLTKYPVSFVQPFLALTYVITPIIAFIWLKEEISLMRIIGISIIIIGVIFVAKSQ